jgi:hypothetical protein
MSQGDYIRLKNIKTRLCSPQGRLQPVLSSQDYTDFAAFSIESTVVNTLPTNTSIVLDSEFRIFDIPQAHPEDFPTFALCNNTNNRPNRVKNPKNESCLGIINPSRPLTKYQQAAAQCRTGFPYTTVKTNPLIGVNYVPYRWPGDNRVKQDFALPSYSPPLFVAPRVIPLQAYRNHDL